MDALRQTQQERPSVHSLLTAYFALAGLAGAAVAISPAYPSVPTDGLYCSDRYGNRVQDGVEYMPEDDPCKKCQCQLGFPVMCRSVLCSPPTCTLYESLKNECCEFRCIQPSLDQPRNNGNGTNHIFTMLKDANSVNLSIRLVASAVTSLLIIALLIFMIHRLRQRRLLIAMRRLNNDRQSVNDALAYMTNIDQLDVGFEFPPYEDPPPPYSPPKPHVDIPAEDPPPYELTSPNNLVATDPGSNSSTTEGTSEQGAVAAANCVRCREDALTDSPFVQRHQPGESCSSELIALMNINQRTRSTVPQIPTCHGPSRDDLPGYSASNSSRRDLEAAADGRLVETTAFDAFAGRQLNLKTPVSQVKKNRKMACLFLLRSAAERVSHPPNAEQTTSRWTMDERQLSSEQMTSLLQSPSNENLTVLNGSRTTSNPCVQLNLTSLGATDNTASKTSSKYQSLEQNVIQDDDDGVMQRSTPEVLLRSVAVNEKNTSVPAIFTNDKSKNKLSLCHGPFLKKHYICSQRPESCSELVTVATIDDQRESLLPINVNDQAPELLEMSTAGQLANSTPVQHEFNDLRCHDTQADVAIGRPRSDKTSGQDLTGDLQSLGCTLDMASAVQPEAASTAAASFRDLVPPTSASGGFLSPESPVYRQFLRSESMTSQGSFFSVCSETGEKKHGRGLLPQISRSATEQNNLVSVGAGSWLLGNGGMRDAGNLTGPGLKNANSEGRGRCGMLDAYSTPNATSSVTGESVKRQSRSGWMFDQKHSRGRKYCALPGKQLHEKRSADDPKARNDVWPFSPNRCLKDHESIWTNENCLNYSDQTLTNNMENRSAAADKPSHGDNALQPSVQSKDAKIRNDNADSQASIESLREDNLYTKGRANSGRKRRSKHLESFENLVSRILQQLETAYFDDPNVQNSLQPKTQKLHCHGNRRSAEILSKNAAKPFRPVSCPSAKNNGFADGNCCSSKAAALDLINRNSRCSSAEECRKLNENDLH